MSVKGRAQRVQRGFKRNKMFLDGQVLHRPGRPQHILWLQLCHSKLELGFLIPCTNYNPQWTIHSKMALKSAGEFLPSHLPSFNCCNQMLH